MKLSQAALQAMDEQKMSWRGWNLCGAAKIEEGSCITSMVRMGLWMMGPLPVSMSKGMFMPVRGVRMSENRMTPSGLNALHGCRDTSTCAHKFAHTLHVLNSCRALTCERPVVHCLKPLY